MDTIPKKTDRPQKFTGQKRESGKARRRLIGSPGKVATSATSLSGNHLNGNKMATEWQHNGQADYGPLDLTTDYGTRDRRNPQQLNASDGVRNLPRPPKAVLRMRRSESVAMCVML